MRKVIQGDALEVLRTLPDNSVDSIVTDPPAGIEFMGKEWDSFKDDKRSKGWATHGGEREVENNGFYTKMRPSFYALNKQDRNNFVSFMTEIMSEALRVLKPGGHALVWALPRTSHWTALALEDAGFEVREKIYHLFGSGFPKSLDVSKAIDRMAGKEREVVSKSPNWRPAKTHGGMGFDKAVGNGPATMNITAPATPEAQQWQGWGTATKPAAEEWILCRKPLAEKSVAAQVLKTGTGAINIDACRVGTQDDRSRPPGKHSANTWDLSNRTEASVSHSAGRWPANLLISHSVFCKPNGTKRVKGTAPHGKPTLEDIRKPGTSWSMQNKRSAVQHSDEDGYETVEDYECVEDCPVRMLDEQSGIRKSGGRITKSDETPTYGVTSFARSKDFQMERSEGGASRYFQRFAYVPKASRAERNRGCENLPNSVSDKLQQRHVSGPNSKGERHEWIPQAQGNNHPTVKPLALMKYLVTLVTPPGGVVLDCFAGSGSTLVACQELGFGYIGIEREEEYIDIINARLAS